MIKGPSRSHDGKHDGQTSEIANDCGKDSGSHWLCARQLQSWVVWKTDPTQKNGCADRLKLAGNPYLLSKRFLTSGRKTLLTRGPGGMCGCCACRMLVPQPAWWHLIYDLLHQSLLA